MKNQAPKNMPASVHQRLLNLSREAGQSLNVLIQLYALEGFVDRLAASRYRDLFVLKGGLRLWACQMPLRRTTQDADLLGRLDNDVDTIVQVVGEICRQPVADDGLSFEGAKFIGRVITADKEYSGVRVTFSARLGNARIPMRVDVGFGDVVVPGAELFDYPSLLGSRTPRIRGYTKESIIAEKVEAMVRHGELLSRIRDLFDVWELSASFEFEGAVLAEALRQTFARRGAGIVPVPPCLQSAYAANQDRKKQWEALISAPGLQGAPASLADVAEGICRFLQPVLLKLAEGADFSGQWRPAEGWVSRRDEPLG